jgi:hypothetical protein
MNEEKKTVFLGNMSNWNVERKKILPVVRLRKKDNVILFSKFKFSFLFTNIK